MVFRICTVLATSIACAAFVPGVAQATTIIGTNRSDVLVGTYAVDTIRGYGGDDTIDGVGESDVIDAGAGFDFVSAWKASRLSLGTGDDIASIELELMDAGTPVQQMQIDCGPGEDFVFDNQSGWRYTARTTNCEEIYAWNTGTTGYGRNGFVPRPDSLLMRGTDGPDRLMGLPRMENMVGGAGNDLIFGNSKPESAGGDLLLGGAGDDVLDTGNNRRVDGRNPGSGPGTVNVVRGGSGNDIVLLRADGVDLDCGAGYDIVYVNGAAPGTGAVVVPGRNCEEVAYMG